MGTGQGPGLRGSAPGGTVQTLLCGEDGGLWESGLGNLGHGYLVSEWGEIGTGMASTMARRDSIVWVNIVTWMIGFRILM